METTMTLPALLEQINSSDPDVRTEAWLRAGEVGAAAVRPLAKLMVETAPLIARLGKELAQLEMSAQDDQIRDRIGAKQEELRQPLEVGRAAKRGLWKIVRHAGRPGAGEERQEVVAELIKLLDDSHPVAVRREVIAMLADIAGDEAVEPLARLLDHRELSRDACTALEKIPTGQSLDALRAGLAAAPDDFKINIARSLQARGVDLPRQR
jgi:HEAT repeat protein